MGNSQQPDKMKLLINQIKKRMKHIINTLLIFGFENKNIEIGSKRIPIWLIFVIAAKHEKIKQYT